MNDETQNRSMETGDSGGDAPAHPEEQPPLSARYAFFRRWEWSFIVSANRAVCEKGRFQFGENTETYGQIKAAWENHQFKELTLPQALEFLRRCHLESPFLFANGNVFVEFACKLVETLFHESGPVRRDVAVAVTADYVDGIASLDEVKRVLPQLLVESKFQQGDRVKTPRGARSGTVLAVLPDGRVKWLPDGAAISLLARPDSLLPD